jgi:hypothetical protein
VGPILKMNGSCNSMMVSKLRKDELVSFPKGRIVVYMLGNCHSQFFSDCLALNSLGTQGWLLPELLYLKGERLTCFLLSEARKQQVIVCLYLACAKQVH